MSTVALVRHGALGDVIMLLNFVSQLRKKYDSIHLISATAKDNMESFLKDYGVVDEVKGVDLTPEEEKKYTKIIRLWMYNYDGTPVDPFPNHVMHYLAKELGTYPPDFNALRIKAPPLPKKIKNQNAPFYITIQAQTDWSIYKNWWGWQELVNKIRKENPNLEIYQIGGPKDRPLSNVTGNFLGDGFKDNLFAQAWATAHLGLDSVYAHTSNIIWSHKGKTKSIILFGSTQASAYGYVHNKNISLGLPCQPCARLTPGLMDGDCGPQTPCENLIDKPDGKPMWACMDGISVSLVYGNLMKTLKDKRLISLNRSPCHTLHQRERLERSQGSAKPEFVYE